MSKKPIHINNTIKAYFIDLDGTLLDDKDHTGKIPSFVNVEACQYAKSIGKHVVISTGRSFAESRAHAKRIGAKYIISSNGAAIHDVDGKLLVEHFISDGAYRIIFDIAKKLKLMVMVRGDKTIYGANSLFKRSIIKRFFNKKGVRGYAAELFFATHKMVLVGKHEKLVAARDEILANDKKLNIVFQNKYLEITNFKASKGKAAVFLAKRKLKVLPEECAHIGDTENDASTAEFLGALIAMKNSTDNLLRVATHLGPDYKPGGVARVIAGDYKEILR